MTTGTIIVLNGTSSAGKSSIVRALQSILDEPYLHAGMDTFFHMLPQRYLDWPLWHEVLGNNTHAGPVGRPLVMGMHQAVAALARAGNHVLVDHVLVEPQWLADCAALFAELPACLIGVRCPLEVALQREQQRRDRAPGQARAHFPLVHAHGIYDFEVDTSSADVGTCARAIKQFLDSGAAPTAFRRLKQHRTI